MRTGEVHISTSYAAAAVCEAQAPQVCHSSGAALNHSSTSREHDVNQNTLQSHDDIQIT